MTPFVRFVRIDDGGIIKEVGTTDAQAWEFLKTTYPNAADYFAIAPSRQAEIGWLFDRATQAIGPRPKLPAYFDPDTVPAGQTTTMEGVRAGAKIRVGSDEREHPGGALVVGFTAPGVYEVRIEAFPFAETTFMLEVTS